MDISGNFYTLKGYQVHAPSGLTPAMEDYLEMICRLLEHREVVRIGELAGKLHVRPSSATKMIRQLKAAGSVISEKYGYIYLTEKGRREGEYLLYRHRVLQRFLCLINHTEDELEQVEKIEHFFNPATIENLDSLTLRLEKEKRF
ncbi:metal-dependent transcriptional regulator [Papillibacter cinnamivorans]|uniref:Manganese transport regulator n=1 Tax=Papillibacter cinnamivorans DSM 12816 TaxID=1122930 RepID=A0A1W1YPB3_9FIRM|nr:iron dependent repressor, metal binding and dimerization domain protein [Papillibacter cinnamivorans]SMC38007.1 iron (metal) dependent repressor, DtxR family [Papillibacter cinnamivorans DSM 12816]